MNCHGCNEIIDCPADDIFPYSLTPPSPFPFIINCPEGAVCDNSQTIRMVCCGQTLTTEIPAGTSSADRTRMVQQLVSQCSLIELGGCGGGGSPDPDDPDIGSGGALWWNREVFWSIDCGNGGIYYYYVDAGTFIGATLASANNQALDLAERLANTNRFCLNVPCLCWCADVAQTINISTVRGRIPFTYEIRSGSLPTGLTLTVVGGVLRISGTPTVAGDNEVTIRVFGGGGGFLDQTLHFYVMETTTTSLPDFTIGEAYSEQLEADGGEGDPSWSLVSGSLPDGLSLSTSGLISGTPTPSAVEETFVVGLTYPELTQVSACEKEFTIEAAGCVNRLFYFSFDAITSSGGSNYAENLTIGSFNANLSMPVGSSPLVSGKISNALELSGIGINQGVTNTLVAPNECVLNLSSRSVTIRYWYKSGEPSFTPRKIVNVLNGAQRIMFELFTFQNTIAITLNNGIDPQLLQLHSLDTLGISPTAWHRVVLVWDFAATEMRSKINNEPFSSGVVPTFNFQNIPMYIWLNPYSPPVATPDDIDEFAVFPDVAWDETDATTDWNGGAGLTWPTVPHA